MPDSIQEAVPDGHISIPTVPSPDMVRYETALLARNCGHIKKVAFGER